MQAQRKSHFERFLAPIFASRFLTVSALIHLLVVVLLAKVAFDRYLPTRDIPQGGIAISSAPLPPQPQPQQNTLPPLPNASQQLLPPRPALIPVITTNDPSRTSLRKLPFDLPAPVIHPGPVFQRSSGPGNDVVLPPGIDQRIRDRDKIGQGFGEKPTADPAVLRALRWLQLQQHSDGTWGSDQYRGAFTGLALLCYLGHGETPRTSVEFSAVVTNAINALAAEGSRNQGRFSFGPGFDGNPAAYQHAICTYALCEAYTMTKDARLVLIIEQAVDYIVKGQRPDGGWAYSYSLDPAFGGSDTSVTGWQIQALKAACLTGIPGMEKTLLPVFRNAMADLDRVFDDKDGSFGYRKAGDRPYTLTGVGVLSKLYWLGRADRTVTKGLKDIRSKDLKYDGPDCNLYTWYYDTQACFQAQGGSWDWWNAHFQDQLISHQSGDGSWPPTGGNDTGGFAKTTTGDGPIYRTTLSCLMLEVFYRYLPTDQQSALNGGGAVGL